MEVLDHANLSGDYEEEREAGRLIARKPLPGKYSRSDTGGTGNPHHVCAN